MAMTYRLQQGLRALLAFTQPVDYTLAAEYLSPQQLALFRQMDRSEQLHSLNVLRDILAQETATPQDLAVAALLHDVGKIRYRLAVWQRTLGVIVQTVAPRLFHRWSQGDGEHPWQRPCVVMVHHPAWGAELAEQAGAAERAVWLIARHADDLSCWEGHQHVHLLKRLQRADDTN